MHLFVWDIGKEESTTLDWYNECREKSLRDAIQPTKSATELGLLVAQYFEKKGVIVSHVPLEHRIFEDQEEENYYSSAWYEMEDLQGKKCRLNIYSGWSLWENKEAWEISVNHLFYLDFKKKGFFPEEAYRKYPLLAVENMAIFPGLEAVAWVHGRSDLDIVLPSLDRYINLTMRYEELVAGQAQRFHGGIERLHRDDNWPYDPLDALVFGYVPLSSVNQIYIEGTWASFDNLCLCGASPIEVGIIPTRGVSLFYPTRQPETSPAVARLYCVYTNVTGGQARIVAENVQLLLSQNLSELGFDGNDKETARKLVRLAHETWERHILED